jgi:hypothetical protein
MEARTFCTVVMSLPLCHRFGEILQCCEGVTEDHIKSAIKKSRVLFNRGEINEVCDGADIITPASALASVQRLCWPADR